MEMPIKISLVLLGTQLHERTIQKLKKYKSKIFTIQKIISKPHLPQNDSYDWSYSKEQLSAMFEDDGSADISIGLIENAIEGNYFMRRVGNNKAVITFFQATEIMSDANIDLLNYLLKHIYEAIAIYSLGNGNGLYPDELFCHDDIRRCIFDMTGNKYDIVHSCSKMCLCNECEARLKKRNLPENFLENLKKEIKRVRKSRYARITEFIKEKPLLSLAITGIASIILSLVSSFLYDLLLCCLKYKQ